MEMLLQNGRWIFLLSPFTPSTDSPYQQAGMMNPLIRAFFLTLPIVLCRSFEFTVPAPGSAVENQASTFQWNASFVDFNTTRTNLFGVYLIKPPMGFYCPVTDVANGLGAIYHDVVEDFIQLKIPRPQNNFSGGLVLRPKTSGAHFMCAYGNFPNFDDGGHSGGDDIKKGDLQGFQQLSFMAESQSFDVRPSNHSFSPSVSPTFLPSSVTPSSGVEGCNHRDCQRSDTPAIVGGIAGGIAVVCVLVAVFYYRRFRYQKKLNQFHKEHQLLHQTPPHSLRASTLTGPSHHGAVSPA
ncbi:hypothetical protein PM082_014926 [Marasmius tenuissimus]|nr:hypothetical protein PM082_014926 [Marasmius tenuissimus]